MYPYITKPVDSSVKDPRCDDLRTQEKGKANKRSTYNLVNFKKAISKGADNVLLRIVTIFVPKVLKD